MLPWFSGSLLTLQVTAVCGRATDAVRALQGSALQRGSERGGEVAKATLNAYAIYLLLADSRTS